MKKRNRKLRAKTVSRERIAFISDRQAYLYSKKKIGFKRKDVNNWPGYCKIVNAIFSTIGEHVVNNPEGVFIEGLGYFGVLMYRNHSRDVKIPTVGGAEYTANLHTNGAVMCLHFLPISNRKSRDIETFLMDGTYSTTVTKAFSDNLFNGKKYRNNAPLFFRT